MISWNCSEDTIVQRLATLVFEDPPREVRVHLYNNAAGDLLSVVTTGLKISLWSNPAPSSSGGSSGHPHA